MIDSTPSTGRVTALGLGLFVVALAGGVGCRAEGTDAASADDSEAAPSEADREPVRTRRQAVDLEEGRSDAFSLDVDLANIDAFQVDGGSTRLETNGHLRLNPGYKLSSGLTVETPESTDEQSVEVTGIDPEVSFEFKIFDQLDVRLETHLQLDSAGDGRREIVDETVTLCDPSEACSPSVDIHGVTYDIVPRARLTVTARPETPGSVRLAFDDAPNRNYLKGGFNFAGSDGWERQRTHDFDLEPEPPDLSETFDGVVEARLEMIYELQLRTSGSTIAAVHLMQASDRIDARVRPPECVARREMAVDGQLRRSPDNSDPYCLEGADGVACLTDEPLYEKTVHESTYQFQDQRDDCTTSAGGSDPEANPQQCTPSNPESCPNADQICMLGRCVVDAPIRIALRWQNEVDLHLAVWDDDGRRLRPLDTADRGEVDGWMAATDGGRDETPQGFIEIAALEQAEANRPLEFQVRTDDSTTVEEPTGYTLLVYHRSQFDQPNPVRELTGKLAAPDRSAIFQLRSDEFVRPE